MSNESDPVCAKCGMPKHLHGPKPDPNVDDGFGGESWYHWHPFTPIVSPAPTETDELRARIEQLEQALRGMVENFSVYPCADTERWREEHQAYENAIAALEQKEVK